MEVVDGVNNLLCMACLCVGRTIRRITDETLKQYYMAILNEIPLCITPQVVPVVCWECDAVLKKILAFKEQVKDSYRILQTYTKENLCEYLLSEVGRPPRLKVHNNECLVITPDEDFLLDTKLIEDSKQEIAEIETVICDGKLDFEKCPINQVRRKIKLKHAETATDCLEVKTEKQEDFQTSEEPKLEEFATVMCDVKRQGNQRTDQKVEVNGHFDTEYKVDKSSADTEESDGASYNNDILNEENGLASDCDREKPPAKVKVKKKKVTRTKTKVVKKYKNTEKDPAADNYRTVTLSYEELQAERTVRARRTEYVCAPHACRSCLRVFPTAAARAQHDTTRHAPELGEYICPICYTVLATVDAFTAHYKKHIRRYECGTCKKRTADVKAMGRHISTHARTHKIKKVEPVRAARGAGGRVACGACDKTFSHRAGLMNHRLAVHEAQNVFPCGACDKVFRWKTSLKRHLEKHNDKSEGGTASGGGASAGGGAGAAYCDACELTFASVCSLQRHLRNSLKHVTQDQLRFICEHCSKRFADKTKLRNHIEEKHLHWTYTCNLCGKPSKNRVGLEQHVRNVHKGRPNNKICHHCGKGFPTKMQLESHIRTHTGERPFICEFCPTTFSQQSNLYKHHRQVHLNIKSKRYPLGKKRRGESEPQEPLVYYDSMLGA
ncbi:zinc finger and BTB domain-containing protein 17-like [Aricia agestis]|uniref:zinc finger and BTB domain-containing protein 17-like n=1 Tax=Aricia agestis TaxID=91739 RepID=UPI001C203571|nr:zinc finger and BTB domain-containing protein 17-like [Aricia agestis]